MVSTIIQTTIQTQEQVQQIIGVMSSAQKLNYDEEEKIDSSSCI